MKSKGQKQMLIPTIIMGILAVLLLGIAYFRGQAQHFQGLRIALNMLVDVLPMLIFALIVAGMVQVLIPQNILTVWIGKDSGWRGILIGSIAGGFCPGGPYTSLPIVAGLLRVGASIGTMVAFLTGWSLWAVARLPMEMGLLGWKFTLIRLTSIFFFPFVAGWMAQFISVYIFRKG